MAYEFDDIDDELEDQGCPDCGFDLDDCFCDEAEESDDFDDDEDFDEDEVDEDGD